MAYHWHEPRVNWIVWARRCAIQGRIPYAHLVECWISALSEASFSRIVLSSWYGNIPEGDYNAGLSAVASWFEQFFSARLGLPIARQGGNQLNTHGPFHARLWKGPLRVLVELEQARQSAGGSAAAGSATDWTGRTSTVTPAQRHDVRTEIPLQRGRVALCLSERKEVLNADAMLLPGDVVEFPFHKFLAACRIGDYQDLAFNGTGSFFLGTSVCRASDGSAGDSLPQLHDNMIAMRFQLLLNMELAAFSALDREVFANTYSRRFHATCEGHRIAGRGMIYAGSLGHPRRNPGRWDIVTNSWGVAAGGDRAARCVASLEGMQGLPQDLPVTPGMSCSPTTILLTHYMYKLEDARTYGRDSVRTTMQYAPTAAQRRLRRPPPETLALQDVNVLEELNGERLQEIFREEIAQGARCNESLRDDINALIGQIDRAAQDAVDRGRSHANWSQLSGGQQRGLESRTSNPDNLHRYVTGQVQDLERQERRAREADQAQAVRQQREVFTEVRDALARAVQTIDQALQTLLSCECWNMVFGSTTRQAEAGRLNSLKNWLQRQRDSIGQTRGRSTRLLNGLSHIIGDFTEVLTDITVLSNNGHEVGMVKVYPHHNLLSARELPRSGFMAAYNPFTGASYFTNYRSRNLIDHGQLYFFEATGYLRVYPGYPMPNSEIQRIKEAHGMHKNFAAKPFRWEIIPDNRLKIGQAANELRITLPSGTISSGNPKAFMMFWRIRRNNRELARRHETIEGWEPIIVRTSSAGTGQRNAENIQQLYAERAVPYATMGEILDGYPTWQQMDQARLAQADHVASIGGTQYANELRTGRSAGAGGAGGGGRGSGRGGG